jgi:hypothetical protein
MSRRLLLGALVVGLLASGCGLATKQADQKKIASATVRTLGSGLVVGQISAVSYPVPPHRPVPPGNNRVGYFATGLVPVAIDPGDGRAAVASGGGGGTPQIIFTPGWMYQRRPANPSAGAAALLASSGTAPSNLATLKAPPAAIASPGAKSAAASGSAPAANSSLSESSGGASTSPYQAVSTQARPWLALDYSALSSRDRTKTAGSLGISPALVLRLGEGALTGSVEKLSDDHSNTPSDRGLRPLLGLGYVVYKANFSLDKAEKGLSDTDKQVIGKVMRANAVATSVFPGAVWLSPDGSLAGLSIVFPQVIDSDNQSLLFVTIVLGGHGGTSTSTLPASTGPASTGPASTGPASTGPASTGPISTRPPRSDQTVTVANLGDLVHQVVP